MTEVAILAPSNIMFVIGILAVIFSVYNSYKKPQEEIEKNQVVSAKDLENKATILAQKEMENKASLLAQQVLSEKESNAQRFKDLNEAMNTANTQAKNDIRAVDIKVDNLAKTIADMNNNIGNEIVRLSTIISERMPKRENS